MEADAEACLPRRRLLIEKCPWPTFWAQLAFTWLLARAAGGDRCSTPCAALADLVGGGGGLCGECLLRSLRAVPWSCRLTSRISWARRTFWEGLAFAIQQPWAAIVGIDRVHIVISDKLFAALPSEVSDGCGEALG